MCPSLTDVSLPSCCFDPPGFEISVPLMNTVAIPRLTNEFVWN